MNESRILLMFANEYDMKTDDGEKVTGCTINYFFFGQSGEALRAMNNKTGSVGYQRAKCSLPYAMRDRVTVVPAIYDAVFEMSVGSDGKPVMKVVDLQYACDVVFNTVPEPKVSQK